ncbi:MAG: sigma-70 family RNA polymerase sigma factor [Bacteroidetes bacterium]|nr:sigma-70 family RNA polymerase sigma factor [Bacteroidota bacterium]MBT5530489.1 sigma-70 family RNA polymerase sigma factor [Cytophagia bacterium]MBT3423100.1 sigma-70 family RNA polymerase sigma factor [Bacteroidota bacterium]MBT3800422.1 sigma-70 family RNA polymerase sigma factor [Bacteroidota bacterium]MBT3934525.1 sigma-70 family RNA polymerase sigma factor [Bacteroidota bacterium]
MRKAIISDEMLIQNYLNGDENCLRQIINRHQSKLFSYILFLIKDRALAEDVFQDTFVKVINTLKSGKYKEEGKFYQWVVRIARNLVIDHFRKVKKMPLITDSSGNDLMASLKIVQYNREDEIIHDETISVLKKLIQSLPKEQKEVLILRHYADLSFKEISDLTNVSINTSLGRMRYALLNLRKMLVKHNINI